MDILKTNILSASERRVMLRRTLIKSGAASGTALLANHWSTGVTSGQENTDEIDIQFDQSGGGWTGGQGNHAAETAIESPGWFDEGTRMTLTPGVYQFEMERIDTDRSIIFEMEAPIESTIDATRIFNEFFDSTGSIYDSPSIEFMGDSGSEEFAVSRTSGDGDIFSTGDVFGTYRFRLLRDGEVLGATQERVHGIGYPAGYQETHQDGTARVTFPAISEIDDSWDISFEIRNEALTDGEEGPYDTDFLHESEFAIDGDQLVTSFELEELEPVPEDGYQLCWIRFSNGEDDGTNLSCRGYFVENGGNRSAAIGGDETSETDGQFIFQRYSDAADSVAVQALLAGGGLTGAYVVSKRLLSGSHSEPEQDHREEGTANGDIGSKATTSDEDRSSADISISSYEQVEIGETIEQSEKYRIDEGRIDGQSVWMLSYLVANDETIPTSHLEAFSNTIEAWAKIKDHASLLNVYEYGMDPYPWAAVQPGDHPDISKHFDTLSLNGKIDVLTQACEAVHHMSRYGIEYKNLTTDSLLSTDEANVVLRGLFDQFREEDLRYAAPEEHGGAYTERSVVYRLGLITYELFTGGDLPDNIEAAESQRTGDNMANGIEHSLPDEIGDTLATILDRALLNPPEDRYETVLHFRDALRDIDRE